MIKIIDIIRSTEKVDKRVLQVRALEKKMEAFRKLNLVKVEVNAK